MNVFVLVPAMMVYLVLCAAGAMDHFSGGFMVLRLDPQNRQALEFKQSAKP